MAESLLKASSSYVNPYEEAYSRARYNRNFNQNMWEQAVLKGEQDKYLGLLRATDEMDMDAEFYDPRYYDYETNILKLYAAGQADDKIIEEHAELKENADYQKYVNEVYGLNAPSAIKEGQLTEKQYLSYILEQDRQARSLELAYLNEKARKEAMTGWSKWWSGFWALNLNIGEGAVRGLAAALDSMVGLGAATTQAVGDKKNWFDAYAEYFDKGLLAEESKLGIALAEYESRYTNFRTLDGELTTSGKYLGQTANAIGYMLPSIVLAYATGGATVPLTKIGVGNLAFYTQIFAQNVYENQTNIATHSSPGLMKVSNAFAQSVSEAAIEWGLSKVIGTLGRGLGLSGRTGIDVMRGAGASTGNAANIANFVGKLNEISGVKGIAKGFGVMFTDAMQEGLEEFLQDLGDMYINYFTSMLKNGGGYGEEGFDFQTLTDSFITGALMSLAMAPAKPLFKNTASKIERLFTKNEISRFDTFGITTDGDIKRLGVIQTVAYNNLLDSLRQDIKDLSETKIGTGNQAEIFTDIKALHGLSVQLGQFFNMMDDRRLKNVQYLFNYINEHQTVYKTDKQSLRMQLDTELARLYNEGETDLADIFGRNIEKIIKTRQNMQVKLFTDAAYEAIETMLSGNARAKYLKDKIAATKNKLKVQESKGASNSVAEASMSTVHAVVDNGEVTAADEKIDERLKTKARKKLEALQLEYNTIFVTDGTDAFADGTTVYMPIEWLENYPTSEIYKYLTEQKILETLLDKEALNKSPKAGQLSFFDQLIQVDADLRGVDKATLNKEQAFMDFLFNPSIYSDMLFGNGSKYFRENVRDITAIFGTIEELAAKSKNKKAYDDVMTQLRETMRVPTIKAIMKWPELWGQNQTLGFYKILSKQDRELVNKEIKRRTVLATGSPRNACRFLTEDDLIYIEDNLDLQHVSPDFYELLQKYKNNEHMSEFEENKVMAFIDMVEYYKRPDILGLRYVRSRYFVHIFDHFKEVYQYLENDLEAAIDELTTEISDMIKYADDIPEDKKARARGLVDELTSNFLEYGEDILAGKDIDDSTYDILDEFDEVLKDNSPYEKPESDTNLAVPVAAFYLRGGEQNPDTLAIDEVVSAFENMFGNLESFVYDMPVLANGMTLEKLGELMIQNGNETFQDFAVYTINHMLFGRFSEQKYFIEARRGKTYPGKNIAKAFDRSAASETDRGFYNTKPIKTVTGQYINVSDPKVMIPLTAQFIASIDVATPKAITDIINNGNRIAYNLYMLNKYSYMSDEQFNEFLKLRETNNTTLRDWIIEREKDVKFEFNNLQELKEYLVVQLNTMFENEVKDWANPSESMYLICEGIPVTIDSLTDELKSQIERIPKDRVELYSAFCQLIRKNCVVSYNGFELISGMSYDAGSFYRVIRDGNTVADRKELYDINKKIYDGKYSIVNSSKIVDRNTNRIIGELSSVKIPDNVMCPMYYKGQEILTVKNIFSDKITKKLYSIADKKMVSSVADVQIELENKADSNGRQYTGMSLISMNFDFLLDTLCHEINHAFADINMFYEDVALPEINIFGDIPMSREFKRNTQDILAAAKHLMRLKDTEASDGIAYRQILYYMKQTERFARLKQIDRPINVSSHRPLSAWNPLSGPGGPYGVFAGTATPEMFAGSNADVNYTQYIIPAYARDYSRYAEEADKYMEQRAEEKRQAQEARQQEKQAKRSDAEYRKKVEQKFAEQAKVVKPAPKLAQKTKTEKPMTNVQKKSFASALATILLTEQQAFSYETAKKKEMFHDAAISDEVIKAMDVLVDSSVDAFTKNKLTVDDIIKQPNKYLKNKLKKELGNKIKDEGYMYSVISQLVNKSFKDISLDVRQPGEASTAQYVFVNNKAFDDILRKTVYDAAKNDGVALRNSLLDKQDRKETVTLGDIYHPDELELMGIPTDIPVILNAHSRGGSYFEVTREYPQGVVHIGFSDRANHKVTDGELLNKIDHEFRHVLQAYNRLSQGFTDQFVVTNNMLADMKKHAPELFANDDIRKIFGGKANQSKEQVAATDKKIAQALVYLLASGEINARGISAESLGIKPVFVSPAVDGKVKVFMPWYDAESKDGVYDIEFTDEEATRQRSSDEYEDLDDEAKKWLEGFESEQESDELTDEEREELPPFMEMVDDLAIDQLLKAGKTVTMDMADEIFKVADEIEQSHTERQIAEMWKELKQKPESVNEPVAEPTVTAEEQKEIEQVVDETDIDKAVKEILTAEQEKMTEDPARAKSRERLKDLMSTISEGDRNFGETGRIHKRVNSIVNLKEETFKELYKYGSQLAPYEKKKKTAEETVEKASRYVPKKGYENTNLKYYFDKGKPVQMSPAFRDFVVATTGRDEELDPVIMNGIKQGKLTQQRLLSTLASTKFGKRATKEQVQNTFELINEKFFANDKFKTLSDVDKFTISTLQEVWALAITMARYDYSMGEFLEQNDLKAFMDLLDNAAFSDIKDVVNAQAAFFTRVTDQNGKVQQLAPSDNLNAQMRLYAMRYFDGSISSAYYIANLARRALIEEDKRLKAELVLDKQVEGKDGSTTMFGEMLSSKKLRTDTSDVMNDLDDYYMLRSAPIDEELSTNEKINELEKIYLTARLEELAIQNPDMSQREIYQKFGKQLIDVGKKYRKSLEAKQSIDPLAVDTIYSEVVLGATVDNTKDVVITTLEAAQPSRQGIQHRIQSTAERLLNLIRDRKIAMSSLDEDIQAMFEKNDKGSWVLKESVYKLGRGRQESDYADLNRESYARDVSKIKATADRLTNYYNKLKSRHKTNTEKLRERLKTSEAKKKEFKDLSKQQEAELKLLRKQIKDLEAGKISVSTAEVTIEKPKSKPARKKKDTSANLAYRSENLKIASFGNRALPDALASILQTSFTEFADNQVQFISKDAKTGEVYDKKSEEFKSATEHEVTSLDKFMDLNIGVLSQMTVSDVLQIVQYFKDGVFVMEGDARKFAAFEVFTLAYIVGNMHRGIWVLSEEDMNTIEQVYENIAGMFGTGLRAIGQVQDIVNPYKRMVSRLQEYGIGLDDLRPLEESIERFNKAETREEQLTLAKLINAQLSEIETKMVSPKIKGSEKFLAYSYMSKLSSPVTWARNIVTNVEMTVMNVVSDGLMNKVMSGLGKKAYREGQIDLAGIKATSEVRNWVNENILKNPMFVKMFSGYTKYNPRSGLTGSSEFAIKYTDANGKVQTAHLNSLINVLAEAIVSDFRATHKFVDEDSKALGKALQLCNNFITKMISDERFIKFATGRYFSKLLQMRVNEGNFALTDVSILTEDVLKDFVESIRLAAADYMHKPSVMADLQAWLKREHPEWSYGFSLLAPFINSSLNFFAEGLKMTPVGLAVAIKRFCNLEQEITKRQELRQTAKGKMLTDDRFVEFMIRRDIGKGIIGTIGLIAGCLLTAFGIVRVKEENDKYKMMIGDVSVDISAFLGTSSFITGMAIISNIQDRDEKKWYQIVEKSFIATFDALSEGFPLRDIYDRYNYTSTFGEAALTFSDNFFRGFVPQALQFFTTATRMYNVKYSNGFKGKVQKFIDSFLPFMTTGDWVIDPYTGKKQSKWAIPIVSYGMKSLLGVYWTSPSSGQKLSESLGVNKKPLTGKITINGKSVRLDYEIVNEKYGELNEKSLETITQQKYNVQMEDGTYKTLSWSRMTDKQRANVLNRMYDHNADVARIYAWTQAGHKYYAGKDYVATLKKAGVKNVYYGDKGFVE